MSDLFLLKGISKFILSDNGPEFIAQSLRDWITLVGSKTVYIEQGLTCFAKIGSFKA